jgi:hypothetical protein
MSETPAACSRPLAPIEWWQRTRATSVRCTYQPPKPETCASANTCAKTDPFGWWCFAYLTDDSGAPMQTTEEETTTTPTTTPTAAERAAALEDRASIERRDQPVSVHRTCDEIDTLRMDEIATLRDQLEQLSQNYDARNREITRLCNAARAVIAAHEASPFFVSATSGDGPSLVDTLADLACPF